MTHEHDKPFFCGDLIYPSKATCDEGWETFVRLSNIERYRASPRFIISTIVGDAFRAGYYTANPYIGINQPKRRKDIKAMLRDPGLRQQLIDGAVDFICKLEGIRD